MDQKQFKLLRRILTVAIIILILATAAFTVYAIINKPTEQAQEQQSSQLPEFRTVTSENDTEHGHETCYDNGICVVQSAEEMAQMEGTNE